MRYRAHAPGSLMLLGEYAVLYGRHALVCAIDRHMTVTLTPRSDNRIEIDSALLGHYATDLETLTIEKPFQFVLGTLKHYEFYLKQGCHIEITADFSDQIGFGSSAAVTAALLSILNQWLSLKLSPLGLVAAGREVVQAVQGVGSGADIAASLYGGMVSYCVSPCTVERFEMTQPLVALYSGYKTPTAEAIHQVEAKFVSDPARYQFIIQQIGECALSGIEAVRQKQWDQLGACMRTQQVHMESLGVNTKELDASISYLNKQPNIRGAKISGSGLGDCAIGLGAIHGTAQHLSAGAQQTVRHRDVPHDRRDAVSSAEHKYIDVVAGEGGIEPIPLAITLEGACCEEI